MRSRGIGDFRCESATAPASTTYIPNRRALFQFGFSQGNGRLKSAPSRISRSPLPVDPSEDVGDLRRYALRASPLLGASATQAHHHIAAAPRQSRDGRGEGRALGNEASAGRHNRNEGIRASAERSRTNESSGELHGWSEVRSQVEISGTVAKNMATTGRYGYGGVCGPRGDRGYANLVPTFC